MLTTDYVPGAPNWLDLGVGAGDLEAATAFYGALFGWEFGSAGPDAGGYGFLLRDGKAVAGAGPLPEEGASPSWTVYFHTADADATAKAVEQAGGKVLVEPVDVFDSGRMAHFADPLGSPFGVWQPRDHHGMQLVNAPGALSCTELYTADAAEAKRFYRSVLGWDWEDMVAAGTDYTVVFPAGGGREAVHGGIVQLPAGSPEGSAGWHPYVEVADCDATVATAVERGATVVIAPEDGECAGRMAMFRDPFGARCAVIDGEQG